MSRRSLDDFPARQPVRGSAVVSGRTGTADPSIDVLVHRLEQLESAQRLQAAELQAARESEGRMAALLHQMAREKEEAEQGLRAAQEELQRLREKTPVSEEARSQLVASLTSEAAKQHIAKRARMEELVQHCRKVSVHNPGPRPVEITVNGLTYVVPVGKCKIPELFMPAWEAHIEGDRVAEELDLMLRGKPNIPFSAVERWRGLRSPGVDTALVPQSKGQPRRLREWDEGKGVT